MSINTKNNNKTRRNKNSSFIPINNSVDLLPISFNSDNKKGGKIRNNTSRTSNEISSNKSIKMKKNIYQKNNDIEASKNDKNDLKQKLNNEQQHIKLVNNENLNFGEIKKNNSYKLQSKKKVSLKVINELPNDYEVIKPKKCILYKIIFVFRDEDFFLRLKPYTLIKNIKETISSLINIDVNQLSLIYENQEINANCDNCSIMEFFNFSKLKSCPIIYIKKKFFYNKEKNEVFENYENKVKIINYPTENIKDEINIFFEKNLSSPDYICTKVFNIFDENYNIDTNLNINDLKNKNNFIIGFCSQNLAFDFNRYMSLLKLTNPDYKEMRLQLILNKKKIIDNKNVSNNSNNTFNYNLRYGINYDFEQKDIVKRNEHIIELIRENFVKKNKERVIKNSNSCLNISSPYISAFEQEIIAKKENKKKWLYPEGFLV